MCVLMLSGCGAESESHSTNSKSSRPTCNEVDHIFEANFAVFDRIATMIYERPMFYKWYNQKYEWQEIRDFLLSRIDTKELTEYFSEEEWQEITALFSEYQLTGIYLMGANSPIEFYWTTSERNSRDELIAVSYIYSRERNSMWFYDQFGEVLESDNRFWYRFQQ